MIVISGRPGQLGNMLIVYAHFTAFAMKHRLRLLNPAFSPYSRYFKGTRKNIASEKLFRLANLSARILHRLNVRNNRILNAVCIGWEERVDLDRPENTQRLKAKLSFVMGWTYRSERLLHDYRSLILDTFSPVPSYEKKLDRFFDSNFGSSELLIGIHARRGDYRNFEGGRYFYNWQEYASVIGNIQKLFAGKELRFLIAGNEDPDEEFLDRFKFVRAPGHELLDLYALARCNYIAGPPSTYSMWASFYGEVPLYMIRDPHAPVALGDFRVQKDFG